MELNITWKINRDRVLNLFKANTLPEDRQGSALLSLTDAKKYSLLRNFITDKIIEENFEHCRQTFTPKPLLIAEPFTFMKHTQKKV